MTLPPPTPPRRGRLDTLTEDRCWRLLDTTTVGRLGFTTDEGIAILPVNFLVFKERVFVRTEQGSTVAALADGRDDVAFEVDHHDDLLQSGWSVLVRGSAAEADPEEAERALASTTRLGPWAPGDRSLVIGLTPRAISGRRVAMH
ncbi:MAG: pyridoxamine 5'-phosphate oxidase family protein [Aeromicrobium sp.]